MDITVLKFGGTSVADNERLNLVADKIIELKKAKDKMIVVVSAQGKTTNRLTEEAKSLSNLPNERELDALLSTGEQVSIAKLGILLNEKGCKAISLTGWQAGIETNSMYGKAKIEKIYLDRINKELEKENVVIVAGFQGITIEKDITTLGREGSDTTAVALAAATESKECYIFSDVDGVYSADPRIIQNAKKIDKLSYEEMQEISNSGAKVLHSSCIQIAERFDIDIIAGSTFSEKQGTRVCKEIESTEVKSVIGNTNLILMRIKQENENSQSELFNIYKSLIDNNIITEKFSLKECIEFYITKAEIEKATKVITAINNNYEITITDLAKLSIIGYGISQDTEVSRKVINILEQEDVYIFDINLSQSKLEIILDNLEDELLNKIHDELIK